MPSGPISNSITTSAPAPGAGRVDHAATAAPVRSNLAGHVQVSASGQPRLGLFQSIGRGIRNTLSRLFSSPQKSGARISTPEQRQGDFRQSLDGVKNALLAKNSTSESIADSLRFADATARKLQYEDGGSLQLTRSQFQQVFAAVPQPELERLARALGSDTAANAHALVSENSAAEHVLMELEAALNTEIEHRVEAHVGKAIDAAIQLMTSGGTPARITDHLSHAFDAAVPLVRSDIVGQGDRKDDAIRAADTKVRQLIVKGLDDVKDGDTRGALLGHLSHPNLKSLAMASEDGTSIDKDLLTEIGNRPARIAANLQTRAQHLAENQSTGSVVNPRAFLRELSGITAELDALRSYDVLFRTGSPSELEGIKKSISNAMEATISSGNLNLKDLSAGEVGDLMATFAALGSKEVGSKLLATAQNEALGQRTQALTQSLQKLGLALRSPNHPEALLKLLSKAGDAAHNLSDACNAFSAPSPRMEGSRATDEAVKQWLTRMPESDRLALRDALAGPNFKPLLEDLDVAETHARQMHQPAMTEDFKKMGLLLSRIEKQITAAVGTPATAAEAAPSPREPLRQALTKLYGLTLSDQRTTLNAGHFNAAQTETAASEVEQPLSTNERSLDTLGTRMVPHQFIVDARRKKPQIFIAADGQAPGKSLIEYGKWNPTTTAAEVDGLIGQGYEKLIEFCGGEEAQARMLSSVLTQNVAASPLIACMGEESPLKLEDGTVGTVAAQAAGGRIPVDITLSKGENGRPRLDISCRYEGRQIFMQPDGSRVTLSRDSHLEMNFSAELGNEGLRLLGAPSYRFNLKRDEFQKDYEPPTAESLREAQPMDDAVTDVLNYATPLGKGYQLTALRAADTFQGQPTVANALAVIAECDRGGEEGSSLVSPEIREKVQTETTNRRQGILSSFDGAAAAAQKIIDARSKAPGAGVIYFNAQRFLEEVAELGKTPAAGLLEEAERLHREFIEPPAQGKAKAEDRRTIPIDREVAVHAGQRLATERQAAAQPAFTQDLFGDLADTLSRRLDTEVLPGMIDAVKRGEI
jgi:hypothetical protein